MNRVEGLADRYGIDIIEDAAHAARLFLRLDILVAERNLVHRASL